VHFHVQRSRTLDVVRCHLACTPHARAASLPCMHGHGEARIASCNLSLSTTLLQPTSLPSPASSSAPVPFIPITHKHPIVEAWIFVPTIVSRLWAHRGHTANPRQLMLLHTTAHGRPSAAQHSIAWHRASFTLALLIEGKDEALCDPSFNSMDSHS